ncbi:hypothetical protein SRB5_69250 [Streptomyces sp. RB5]|uniref:Uncharacterized protein n=1 Tax=Streptomyces smaragdinus TaxID=2585196 RepID=A0A7K0CTP4_9ACTN|nr:hypothetical protein [Streptomyces smaragdinus]MQY16723.1 hypothetical protein [Streptomyces smaragdinus]
MTTLGTALIEEASKKSGLLWVDGRALWHAWLDGAVHVVGGGQEQPLSGLEEGALVRVVARSKDKGGRIVAWDAKVSELAPNGEAWTAAVAELKGKRLNAPDGEQMTGRWARECRVLRLEATGAPDERLPDDSLAARPVPTPNITRRPIPAGLPKLLFRRRGK